MYVCVVYLFGSIKGDYLNFLNVYYIVDSVLLREEEIILFSLLI